ncbi:DUF58 domain-containing protein [Formosa algae]|uniref:Uncharacterized protein (DUF58 family) n=1 Tax=Formosa algae TaxID=225843 RepID=A0A9X0YN87_9FLAO|nr:DUF58 domain-containing protein [Formosa algae]MBP1841675.1 uncharacterized protein (DUF58 family) [Formosa algae]MDQ0337124.1 uncharacterized protein (DUF58 family) [Formosa algae]OEI80543.1 cell division protein FtsB [Formosa algae]
MKQLYNTLFLNTRLFYILGGIAVLFVVGYFAPIVFYITKILCLILGLLVIIDILILYKFNDAVTVTRTLPERLSNGDTNTITLQITNTYPFICHLDIIEELPFQFQKRDFLFNIKLKTQEQKTLRYDLNPTKRGTYNFGYTNVYVSSPLQLATKKYILSDTQDLKCYPSFLKLRAFHFRAFTDASISYGTKKVRRIGHSLEFEQIKEYTSGDDIRTLNWKATAKRNQLMVNQYVEEKAQPVYAVIDKGRAMQMHFNNMSLLDYAVNATLAISHAVLRKQDKAGMLSFSKQVEDIIVAEQRHSQMHLISEALYNIKTDFSESDFSSLYAAAKRKITNRSLFILYTNFETMDGLNRQLPYLRALAKNHLLLVVFFKNTELNTIIHSKSDNIQGVYDAIIAEKFMYEKKKIVKALQKYGIQSVLTEPENLTGDTINKYLELKSRGLF